MVSRFHLPKSISHIYLMYISYISHMYLIYVEMQKKWEKVSSQRLFSVCALTYSDTTRMGKIKGGNNRKRQKSKRQVLQDLVLAYSEKKKKSKTREQGPFEFPLRKFVNSMQIPWFVQLNPTQLATWKWRGCSSKKLVDIF